MGDDELFSYVPEVEEVCSEISFVFHEQLKIPCPALQTYSEKETEDAMKFMKENDLPMSDMYYALKYVRISNRVVKLDVQFQHIRERLNKLREEDIRTVSPPPGDWDPKLSKLNDESKF